MSVSVPTDDRGYPFNDQIHREWLAWRQLCKQLAKLHVDVNQTIALASAIRLWGEELHALRLEEPAHDTAALAEKRAEYEPFVIDGWAP